MNTYRVDANVGQFCVSNNTTPCGMTTIRYIGDSVVKAEREFRLAVADRATKDCFLSRYVFSQRDYVVIEGHTKPLFDDLN